jgi:hypothetical protein
VDLFLRLVYVRPKESGQEFNIVHTGTVRQVTGLGSIRGWRPCLHQAAINGRPRTEFQELYEYFVPTLAVGYVRNVSLEAAARAETRQVYRDHPYQNFIDVRCHNKHAEALSTKTLSIFRYITLSRLRVWGLILMSTFTQCLFIVRSTKPLRSGRAALGRRRVYSSRSTAS